MTSEALLRNLCTRRCLLAPGKADALARLLQEGKSSVREILTVANTMAKDRKQQGLLNIDGADYQFSTKPEYFRVLGEKIDRTALYSAYDTVRYNLLNPDDDFVSFIRREDA